MKIVEIFKGKEHTKEYDLEIAKAIIEDKIGKIYTITREGQIENWGSMGHCVFTGTDRLQMYMCDSKRQILVDDSGEMVPVCNIKNIIRITEPKLETFSWR